MKLKSNRRAKTPPEKKVEEFLTKTIKYNQKPEAIFFLKKLEILFSLFLLVKNSFFHQKPTRFF